ncbi:MAG: hypothetical protein ACYSUI_16740 [Planctomycetota bacterium]|jgi:uncharacterized membrane protein
MRALGSCTIGLLFVIGCATGTGGGGGDGGDADCGKLTYENFARGFFTSYCIRCHSSELSGADRNGAPAGLDWDDLEVVGENLDRIRVRAAETETMPPSDPRPFDEERDMLAEWIDCDAPAAGDG